MIEHLNARRMIAIIVLLIFLCIIIVILEETITDNVVDNYPIPYNDLNKHNHQQNQEKLILNNNNNNNYKSNVSILNNNNKNNSHLLIDHNQTNNNIYKCPIEDEEYNIEIKCTLCTKYERNNHINYCLLTGYKEQIYCKKSRKKLWHTCYDVIQMFYLFELFMLLMSIVFIFYVKKRQLLMNRLILNRIEKQLSSGV